MAEVAPKDRPPQAVEFGKRHYERFSRAVESLLVEKPDIKKSDGTRGPGKVWANWENVPKEEALKINQIFQEAAAGFFDLLRGAPQDQTKVAEAMARGENAKVVELLQKLYPMNPESESANKNYYQEMQRLYDQFASLFSHHLPEGTPKTLEGLLKASVLEKARALLREETTEEVNLVKEKVEPASREPGTFEQKTTQSPYPARTDKKSGEVNLPERPKIEQVDEKQDRIPDQETARKLLNLPDFYQRDARRRAEIQEEAGVELTRSRAERELEEHMEYRPYGYYFSELIDKYEEYQGELGEKLRQKVVKESAGKPEESRQLAAVLDYKREDAERDPKMYIAGAMQVLLSMIARRKHTEEEVASLRAIIDSCEHIVSIYDTPKSREKAAEYRKIQQSLSYFAEGAIELVEFWQHYLTGDESLMTTTYGAAKGTTAKMNEILFLWWHDPGIEKAFHTASVRSKDDLNFATKLSFWGGKIKTVYETEDVPGVSGRKSLKQNDRRKVAQNVIGEILNVTSLKIRKDPAQASDIAYTVYREDQFGLQHSDLKYDAEGFSKMLRVNRAGRIELINNNEMATLFTFENSVALIDKWINLIQQSTDYENTGIFIGRKNLAALISWAGEIDPRNPENPNSPKDGEALDFDTWLELSPEKQDEVLTRHLKRFLDDKNFKREGQVDKIFAKTQREKIIQRNLARTRTRFGDKKLLKPINVQSGYTGETKTLEYVPILEPVIDLDEHWFNPLTKQWEYCLNSRWFFQEEPGVPLVIGNERVLKSTAQMGLGNTGDPKDIKNSFFAREGQITGQMPVSASMLFIYEGYKQSDAKHLATMIKAGSVSLFQEHQKLFQELTSEERGKQSYSIPEYYAGLVNYLLGKTIKEEVVPSLYVARYAGRHMEFLGNLDQYKRFVDLEIDNMLDFETTNTDGSYVELMASQRVSPERRVRQLMMRNAYKPVWEHFAKANKMNLEELLTFAGLQEKTQGKTRLDAKGQETGYMELEIIEESSKNSDGSKKWKTQGEWKVHDNWREDKDSASFKKISTLMTAKPELINIYRDFERAGVFQTSIFHKWDLWTQTRKIVLKYVDDLFLENETVSDDVLKGNLTKGITRDRIVAEIIRDREFKRKEYGELYGDPDRDPKSLRWVTFDDGQEHEMYDLWKRRQIYNKILREHQIPMGDEMVNGKYMFTQWEDLEFLENGAPNPDYHNPKIKVAKIKEDGILEDFQYFNEIPEINPDERRLAMAYNAYREKEQEVMKKYAAEREEIVKMTRNTEQQIEEHERRYGLYLSKMKQEVGENPLTKTHYAHSFLSGMGGGLCQGLDLAAGWWEFQPETGLTERWPDWLEPEFVVGMVASWSAPHRLAMAERLTDVAYRHNHQEIKFVTPDIRKSQEWKEIYEPKVEDQMLVAMGPDHFSNLIFKLRGEYTEGFMDNEPAKELLARQLGVDDEGKIGRRYITYLHKLNFRGGKVDNPYENPDAWKELDQSLESARAKFTKDIQKSPVLEAMPDGAKALTMLLGDDPEAFIKSGKTDRDAPGKIIGGLVIPSAPVVLAGANFLLNTAAGLPGWVGVNNALAVAAAVIPTLIMRASGWMLAKDREKGNLVPARFGGTAVVDAEEINLYQAGKIKEYFKHWWERKKPVSKIATIGLPFLSLVAPPFAPIFLSPWAAPLTVGLNYILTQKLGIKIKGKPIKLELSGPEFLKPLTQRRKANVLMGRAHTAIIDPKPIIVKVGTEWKDRFGSSLAGRK